MTTERQDAPTKPATPEPQSGESLAAPPCSANAVRWLEMQEADWQRRQRKEWPPVRCAVDILNDPEPPEWEQRDSEYQYRKGFYHGIAEAAELVSRLYKRGGYVRPQEIANILGAWTNDLRKWMSQSMSEQPLKWNGHPSLKWTPWPEVKKNVHERDEWACTQCGATTELEAHHIEAVCDGGLPELDNLVTLCKTCHR